MGRTRDGLFKQQYKRADGRRGETDKWYGHFRDENGKRRRVGLSTDRQVSRTMLADLERHAERRKAGIIDEYADARRVPLDGLIDDYLDYLRLKGDGERHRADTQRLLNTVVRECGFETVADLRADTLDRFLGRLSREGRAARTVNTYRQAATGFGGWLRKTKRMVPDNPLADSTRAEGPVRIKRRALGLDQLRRLLDVARVRPVMAKQTIRSGTRKGELTANVRREVRERLEREGRQRVMLYKAAFYTGLRRGELKALRVHHLIWADAPHLRLPGRFTKNKQDAKLPLHRAFADELRAWIADEGRSPDDPVFRLGRDVAKHLKRDMAMAGIPVVDVEGKLFDFHAFRKCTATYMNRAGVPITTAKETMRHSTVELTAGVYNDGEIHDLHGAVAKLPTL